MEQWTIVKFNTNHVAKRNILKKLQFKIISNIKFYIPIKMYSFLFIMHHAIMSNITSILTKS